MRRLGFIDVTLRDGHQCLWATRMTSAMMAPILSTIDRAGYDYINILGGAVFDVCVRYLHENPWRRVEMLCRRLQTPTDGFLRGLRLQVWSATAGEPKLPPGTFSFVRWGIVAN